MTAITVNFQSIIEISDEQFYQLCIHNRDLKFERNADGEIIIMPPTGGEAGKCNIDLIVQLGIWNRQTKLGWLINPDAKQVEIYRLGQDVELLDTPQSLSGEDILTGFVLDLTNIF